ncbi:MAG: IPTL-CTERM sorting domain-containing protein [Proteobacteria bacterium]|nr:IPTL-CTERM sorting domain-containing protein [Pseudomonadota bacterium]
MLGLLAPLTANAAPVNMPFSTIGVLPDQSTTVTGTLSNGVAWEVRHDPPPADLSGVESWPARAVRFYNWQPSWGDQVWTFSVPVNLSFQITNLNGGWSTIAGALEDRREGVVLPAGTVCDLSAVPTSIIGIRFDPTGTHADIPGGPTNLPTLWYEGVTNSPSEAELARQLIPCTLNNTTELRLGWSASNQTWVRGLHSLTVTPVATPFNISTASVPVLNPVSLTLLALALGGMAFWRRRQIS